MVDLQLATTGKKQDLVWMWHSPALISLLVFFHQWHTYHNTYDDTVLLIHTPGILSPNDTIQLALSWDRHLDRRESINATKRYILPHQALCVFVVKYKQDTHWLIYTLCFDAHITTLKDANRRFLIVKEKWPNNKWRKQNDNRKFWKKRRETYWHTFGLTKESKVSLIYDVCQKQQLSLFPNLPIFSCMVKRERASETRLK